MSIHTEIEDVLHRLDVYKRTYEDESLIRRLLGLRAALFSMIEDKWDSLSTVGSDNAPEATRCQTCHGTGIAIPESWLAVSRVLNRDRMTPNVFVDQCPVAPIDLVRRVAMMQDLGDIRGKRILCIGDNDLASLLIAFVCKPGEIVVVENDDRVIEFLNTEASSLSERGLPSEHD